MVQERAISKFRLYLRSTLADGRRYFDKCHGGWLPGACKGDAGVAKMEARREWPCCSLAINGRSWHLRPYADRATHPELFLVCSVSSTKGGGAFSPPQSTP